MKVLVIFAAFIAVATAEDLICKMGEAICKINCMASGYIQGLCNETGNCECQEKMSGSKAELICIFGGDLACEIYCVTSEGNFQGKCTDDNGCICGDVLDTTQTRPRRHPEPNGIDMACKHGDDEVCASYCHWTRGKREGFCDAGDNCHCEAKPSVHAADNLPCKDSIGDGVEACARYCWVIAEEKKAHCDVDGNCICG